MIEQGFRLHGRVQGVGFRWWTRKTAEAMGVTGSVKNLADGSVEVMARADEETMQRFADKLSEGPTTARVERVDEVPAQLSADLDSFRIER